MGNCSKNGIRNDKEGKACVVQKCGATKSSVIDSRQLKKEIRLEEDGVNANIVLRPMNVEERTLVVVKKDGTREQFSRDKIFNGINCSAQNVRVSSDEISAWSSIVLNKTPQSQ